MSEQDPTRTLQALKALFLDAHVFGVEGFGRREPLGPGSPSDSGSAVATPTHVEVGSAGDSLARIAEEAEACRRCSLGSSRQRCVPGVGSDTPDYVFIGEAPGVDEDRQGVPFVGAAGELLDRMIIAMGLSRETVFIANVLKCRPPNNRDPAPDEVAACLPFLRRQLQLLRPKVVIALGAHAAQNLLGTEETVGKLRGRAHPLDNATCVVTYHPTYLLRSPHEKAKAWEDLKFALSLTGRVPPPRA